MCIGGGGASKAASAQSSQLAADSFAEQKKMDDFTMTQAATDRAEAQNRLNKETADTNNSENAVNKVFGGYDQNYYNNLGKQEMDYYAPQIEDQTREAQKKSVLARAQSVLLDSSVRAGDVASITKTRQQALADLASKVANDQQTRRQQLVQAQGNLRQQAVASHGLTDPTSMATSSASALSGPLVMEPLGNVFSTITSQLGQQANLQQYGYPGIGLPNVGPRLYGSPTSSVSTVGG